MSNLTQKLSVTLPSNIIDFIKEYKTKNNLRSDSEAVHQAIKLLQNSYLEKCYTESAHELAHNSALKNEAEILDRASSDGISPENW